MKTSYIAGQKYERRTIVTLTEVGDLSRIRVSNMPYKVWNEPNAVRIKKAEMWKDENDNWIELKPAIYAPAEYALLKKMNILKRWMQLKLKIYQKMKALLNLHQV